MTKTIKEIWDEYYQIYEENKRVRRELIDLQRDFVSRKMIIDRLRPVLTDETIGDILGITRERVAQIGGRRHANNIMRKNPASEYDSEIKDMALKGFTCYQIKSAIAKNHKFDISSSGIAYSLRSQGVDKDALIEARRKLKLEEIGSKLREFVKTGRPFRMFDISKWSYNICSKMQRILPYPDSTDSPFKQWADYLGVEWKGYSYSTLDGVRGHAKRNS